jgi:hypothetical protein
VKYPDDPDSVETKRFVPVRFVKVPVIELTVFAVKDGAVIFAKYPVVAVNPPANVAVDDK